MSYLIDEHLERLALRRCSPHTIEDRAKVLRALHEWLPAGIAYAATEQLNAWLGHEPSWTRSTLSTYRMHIRGFFAELCKRGELDGDPSLEMNRFPQPRLVPNPVTDAELDQLLATVPEPLLTAVILAAYAGLRVSEVAACRRQDITVDLVHVPHGKGDEYGTVPTHEFVWAHVGSRPRGLLVLGGEGHATNGDNLSRRVSRWCGRNGLPGVRMHRLRHWYGTTIQALQGDLRVTQECMRHASVSSTAPYTLVTGARRAAAVAALPVHRTAPASF